MRTRLEVADFAMAALKQLGIHRLSCQYGGHSWREGDLGMCNCPLGDAIKKLAEVRAQSLEPSLRRKS